MLSIRTCSTSSPTSSTSEKDMYYQFKGSEHVGKRANLSEHWLVAFISNDSTTSLVKTKAAKFKIDFEAKDNQ